MSKTIQDLMSKNLVTVEKGTMVKAALEIMERNSFRHLPVINEDGRVVGILSDRDFLSVADFEKTKVDSAMTTLVQSVPANAPIKKSIMTMVEKKISCLIVIDEKGLPVGIVTTDDVLKEYAKTQN